jgi:hypothetical protein
MIAAILFSPGWFSSGRKSLQQTGAHQSSAMPGRLMLERGRSRSVQRSSDCSSFDGSLYLETTLMGASSAQQQRAVLNQWFTQKSLPAAWQ